MGSLRSWSYLWLIAVGVTGCSSWTGPQGSGGGTPIPDTDDIGAGDSGVPGHDDGELPHFPSGDAGPPKDPERTSELGDDRVGFEHCGAASCGADSVCCTSPSSSWCAAGCGTTESTIDCDGPEDCGEGQVCCHTEDRRDGVRTECVDAELAASDAGPATRACAGPALHVACHADSDCAAEAGSTMCRAAKTSGGLTLGYCRGVLDDAATPGHDDVGFVGCGVIDGEDGAAGESCDLENRICCLSRARPDVAGCGAIAECGQSEIQVYCDGPEDCEGASVCCHMPAYEANGVVVPPSIECADHCDTPGARTRCHTAADCGQGWACEPDPSSPWWGSCVPR